MAVNTGDKYGAVPKSLELAREAAEHETQDAMERADKDRMAGNRKRTESKTEGRNRQFEFTGFAEKEKSKRVTRTFTMEPETEDRLDKAARQFGVSKSAILERAFNDWYNMVEI